MMKRNTGYTPALKFKFLTNAYDLFVKITLPEYKFKTLLIEQAVIDADDKVLDFGCGTGTLLIMIKGRHPTADVHGIDIDPRVLEIAGKKADDGSVAVALKQYDGTNFPFADSYFDKVVTSLVFHHLTTAQKNNALNEILRVLKPGGHLHIADFGRQPDWLMSCLFFIARTLEGYKTTSDNAKGNIPVFMKNRGFEDVEEHHRVRTIFGAISYYSGRK